MHRAIGHNFVDAVAGPAQREAEVVCHAQQLSKIDTCARNRLFHYASAAADSERLQQMNFTAH